MSLSDSPWKPPPRIEREYARAINSAMRQLMGFVSEAKTPDEIVRNLLEWARQPAFTAYSQTWAMRMTTALARQSAATWRQAAAKSMRGKDIFEALNLELKTGGVGTHFFSIVSQNAAFIKTLPYEIARQITDYTQKQTIAGVRHEDIAKDILKQFPEKTKANAQLIARTEVSKTQCAIVQARAQNLGLDWYTWRTSEDQRVRPSHSLMDGVLIRWDDPPSPEELNGEARSYGSYHAGNIFNCRCYPEPVIDISDIDFPAKVYYGGNIVRMREADFRAIA